MQNLEGMLKEQESLLNNNQTQFISSNPPILMQQAEKSASLYDFIEMVDKLITLTMKDIKFIPDEGKAIALDPMTSIDGPIITYKVIQRKPKAELKPRVRQSIIEKVLDSDEERLGEVWGQKFECLIQFNILASVYKEAEQVMEKFEELITMYTGFFKKSGVAELFFKEHLTDESYGHYRETLSVRNLRYYVEIEKLTVIFREKIKDIEILAQQKEEI